jgi:hypothetical protein
MDSPASDTLRRWPVWALPVLGAALVGTVVAGVSHFSTSLIDGSESEQILLLLVLAGGAIVGAYLGWCIQTSIARRPMATDKDLWQTPLNPKHQRRRRRLARESLLETWGCRAALLDETCSSRREDNSRVG